MGFALYRFGGAMTGIKASSVIVVLFASATLGQGDMMRTRMCPPPESQRDACSHVPSDFDCDIDSCFAITGQCCAQFLITEKKAFCTPGICAATEGEDLFGMPAVDT